MNQSENCPYGTGTGSSLSTAVPLPVISPLMLHIRRSSFYDPGLIQQALVKPRRNDILMSYKRGCRFTFILEMEQILKGRIQGTGYLFPFH
jgi:hypothetical protein